MAKRKCTPCLDPEWKALLAEAFPRQAALIAGVADCGDLYLNSCEGTGKTKGGSAKRAPSKFAVFVKECFARKKAAGQKIEFGPGTMKACAAEWKARKGV